MIFPNGLPGQGLLWALLSFPAAILAQGAGCTNVTISSAADADAIRKSCKTIVGDLTFAESFNETITLDGIEVIEGDIKHSDDRYPWACETPGTQNEFPCNQSFTISSSTLRRINGSISFWFFHGLEELLFPNLVRMEWVALQRLYSLKTLDLTNLQYIEYFQLEAMKLEKFLLDELQEFTGPNKGGVQIMVGPKVENIDGLFRNNLDPWLGRREKFYNASGSEADVGVSLNLVSGPNLKSLTFGWKQISSLRLYAANEFTVVFGGPNSTEVEIDELVISGSVAKIERGEKVKNITIWDLALRDLEKMTTLDLPFDQLGGLLVANATELTSVILPPQAENWREFSLIMYDCPKLNLTSEYTIVDGERKKTWYWPKNGDYSFLQISARLSTEFL